MEPIWKGKQTNKTSNTCASDKGKQTNKQAEVAHAEAWMQGEGWSCITCRVQYAMHQSMWKSFGDALEMDQKSAEFNMQGHTLTISHYVASYVAGCDACNHCKSFPPQKVGKLMPNQIPSPHGNAISLDTIRELPESNWYNAILIVVDRLSKCIHAMPTVTMIDSAALAHLFTHHLCTHLTLPDAPTTTA